MIRYNFEMAGMAVPRFSFQQHELLLIFLSLNHLTRSTGCKSLKRDTKTKFCRSCTKSTYAKVHGSVSVDALQKKKKKKKKKTHKNQLGKLHDPAFKITEIYCQEKLLCNFLVKMEITDHLLLIFLLWFWKWQCTISSKYSWSNVEVFGAKRISYCN